MTLPKHFCWTRFGTEAGETIDAILKRKELERLKNGGVFLWGIGNAVGPSMKELVQRESCPEVIFSPIRSRAKHIDVAPAATVIWKSGRDLNGVVSPLPSGSTVVSRISSKGIQAARHYALVCFSDKSLQLIADPLMFSIGSLENIRRGSPIGASQVTAIVRQRYQPNLVCQIYPEAMRFQLVAPFFLELLDPSIVNEVSRAWI